MLYELPFLRQVASRWYDGQASALYAYTSTGTVLPGIEREIKQCMDLAETRKDWRELSCLYAKLADPVSVDTVELGTEFWHRIARNSDGSPVRCRKNGKIKLWKRSPTRFSLPVKYGLRDCFYITEANANEWVIAP